MGKRIGIIAAAACAIALCFSLVGCGGGTDKSKYVGSWELVSGSESALTAESVQALKEKGKEVSLTLNEDGTGTIDVFGEALGLTWQVANGSDVTVEISDIGPAKLKIEEESLVMEDENSTTMTFSKKG